MGLSRAIAGPVHCIREVFPHVFHNRHRIPDGNLTIQEHWHFASGGIAFNFCFPLLGK